jgi:molybdopterin molybdotransferase
MSPLVPVREQLERVLSATPLLDAERVPLEEAMGRRLAEDVTSAVAVPPWDNSAMDGYALRHEDVASGPLTLAVVADVPAGSTADPRIGPGQAVRIMTGATLPSDADTVVRLEDTDRTDPLAALPPTVTVLVAPSPGMHVRRAGEDRGVGDHVATRGSLLTATLASGLASAGHRAVLVVRPPRVAVITTGSELVPPGSALKRGLIPDSNGVLVSGLVRDAGGRVVCRRHVGDEPAQLAHALTEVGGCDAVILTGGVSAGAFDPVRRVFAGSDDVAFSSVAMQPGKPQAFGRLPGGALLFGLPGNPVSAWVSFHAFVRPALLTMQGAPTRAVTPAPWPVKAGTGWDTPNGRTQYIPVTLDSGPDGWTVRPVSSGGSASHLVASLAGADGYAVVPAGSGPVRAGDTVAVHITSHD